MDKITKGLSVAKDLPSVLKGKHANDDNGFWLYASREVVDSAGDIVRIDGIDLSKYHDPANGVHLKILAQHIKVLADGTAPVVAIVKDFVKTNVPYNAKSVKSLALYCEWLRDKEGNLLPLSKHYKDMVDSGGIDSGSVGMMVDEYEPLKEGGIDIKKSTLFETSLVTIPCNGAATMVRSKLADIGYELDETVEEIAVEQPEEKNKSEPHTDISQVEGTLQKQLAPLAKMLEGLAERLDTIESAVVILTQGRKSLAEDDRKTQDIDHESLAVIKSKLDELNKFISR